MKKTRYILSEGVGLTAVLDKRFKNEFLSVNFLSPLKGYENALSYLLPSVLVRGCQKYGSMQQMNALLEEAYDGEIGTDTYRVGDTRIIRFSGAWLRADMTFDLSDPGDTVLDILRQIILFPLKEEDGCLSSRFTELEKQSLCDFAMSEKNNKRSYALNSCIKLMLEGDEYAHPKYGSEEEIMAVSNGELTTYYQKMLEKSQIEIYYHGKNDGEEMVNKIKSVFAELITPRSELEKPQKTARSLRQDILTKSENGDCEQTVLVMGFAIPNTNEEKYSLMMLGEILGLSPVSRLFMNVREKRGLCYYCDLVTLRAKQSAFITAGIEFKRRGEAMDAILGEIKDVAEGNLSESEINTAKTSIINSYLSFFDSPKDHESLVLYSVLGSEYLTPEEHEERIINITTKDISEMAKKMVLQTVFTLTGN